MRLKFHGHNGAPIPKTFAISGGGTVTVSEGLNSAGMIFFGEGETEDECRANALKAAKNFGWPEVSRVED